jgi:hypothetical protein
LLNPVFPAPAPRGGSFIRGGFFSAKYIHTHRIVSTINGLRTNKITANRFCGVSRRRGERVAGIVGLLRGYLAFAYSSATLPQFTTFHHAAR